MKLPVLLAILGVVLPVVVMLIIAWCIISGSNVDPDDNGLLKSKEAKEKWQQKKLKKFKDTDSF